MAKSIEIGSKVRCTETGQLGVVLDKRRGAVCMYAKVLWDTGLDKEGRPNKVRFNATNWVETVELKLVDEPE